jgi:hypothetical protein
VFREKQASLELYVKNNFDVAFLAFENTPSPNPEIISEWARIAVLFGDSNRMQLGQPGGYRHPGVLTVQVFIREGVGIDRGVELADTVAVALRDHVVDGVNLLVPKINKIPFADKGWVQVQVATPFYFDEVT